MRSIRTNRTATMAAVVALSCVLAPAAAFAEEASAVAEQTVDVMNKL